jgi:hypothetical protein
MNGNESEHEKSDPAAISPKPWYQTKSARIILLSSLVMLVFWYMFYRPLEVNRGPWQALDPGQPVEPLKFEVVEEGNGPVVEPGDLIQISLWYWSNEHNRLERRDDDWWIWIGFRTEKETPFHSISPRLISAFVGLMEGGVRFPVKPSHSLSEKIYPNPFGSPRYFWNDKFGGISFPTNNGYTVVHIKKVFKGQLRYRTTRLYDRTWFFACYNFLSAGRFSNKPREAWYDDARYDGASADGQKATFLYGPVTAPGSPWIYPSGIESLAAWSKREWRNLPVGVRVE